YGEHGATRREIRLLGGGSHARHRDARLARARLEAQLPPLSPGKGHRELRERSGFPFEVAATAGDASGRRGAVVGANLCQQRAHMGRYRLAAATDEAAYPTQRDSA